MGHVAVASDADAYNLENQRRVLADCEQVFEALQLAREQGLSLRAIARNLAMGKNTAKKYASVESPPTEKFSAKERAKGASQGEGSGRIADRHRLNLMTYSLFI